MEGGNRFVCAIYIVREEFRWRTRTNGVVTRESGREVTRKKLIFLRGGRSCLRGEGVVGVICIGNGR